MRKLVLFDVDNTIIKGNLTTHICSQAIHASPFNYLTWLSLLFKATRLLHRHFLEQIERCLLTQNFILLDQTIQNYAGNCYRALFRTLQKANIDQKQLKIHAERFCAPSDFIETHCYPQALETIQTALEQPETEVLFLSGGLGLFLNLFVQKLNQYFLTVKKINNPIIAFGSTYQPDEIKNILVGSKKATQIRHYIDQSSEPIIIESVYSDNRYFADLPLLQLATKSAVIIDESSLWYDLLPPSILASLRFKPNWKES